MGADGGIVGVRLKGEVLTSQTAMRELTDAVPWELQFWDDYDHKPYCEAEERPGWWYSTYGSFQDWDLGDLIEMVEEAQGYLQVYPDATFETWCEDIYTNPLSANPGWLSLPNGTVTGWGRMSTFLAERYMGWRRQTGTLNAPENARYGRKYEDGFYSRRVSSWVNIICKHVDIALGADWQETWT